MSVTMMTGARYPTTMNAPVRLPVTTMPANQSVTKCRLIEA